MIKRVGRYLRQHHLALLALFMVLGGSTAYAAATLVPKNSVGSPQVINGSLQTLDLSKKARKALKGNRGPRGFRGARGATGAQGARGATGPAGPATGPAGGALTGNYPNPGLAAPEGFQTPTFNAGWQNVGGSFQTAGFYKDPFGIVHLRGDVQRVSGTDSTIFVMPVGYRPSALENFAAYGNGGTAAGVAIRASDGNVVLVAGDVGFIGLGGISYRAG
jgi:hypothetical protein